MGWDILVVERNWESVNWRSVHSGELHGEWCRLDVTGGLNGN